MKYLLTCLLSLLLAHASIACSCSASQSWCQIVSNQNNYDSLGVAWFGELIDSVPIDVNVIMYKFRVYQLFKGEIIKPDSRLATQDSFSVQFENSDSVIWLVGGSDASCRRYFSPGSYMVSSIYTKEQGGPFDIGPFGYSIFFCDEDVLKMDSDSTFSGFIGSPEWEGVGTEKVSYLRLIELTNSNACLQTVSSKKIPEEDVKIFPNPATKVINIVLTSSPISVDAIIYDLKGQIIRSSQLTGNKSQFKIEDIPSGIYVLKLQSVDGILTRRIYVSRV